MSLLGSPFVELELGNWRSLHFFRSQFVFLHKNLRREFRLRVVQTAPTP